MIRWLLSSASDESRMPPPLSARATGLPAWKDVSARRQPGTPEHPRFRLWDDMSGLPPAPDLRPVRCTRDKEKDLCITLLGINKPSEQKHQGLDKVCKTQPLLTLRCSTLQTRCCFLLIQHVQRWTSPSQPHPFSALRIPSLEHQCPLPCHP